MHFLQSWIDFRFEDSTVWIVQLFRGLIRRHFRGDQVDEPISTWSSGRFTIELILPDRELISFELIWTDRKVTGYYSVIITQSCTGWQWIMTKNIRRRIFHERILARICKSSRTLNYKCSRIFYDDWKLKYLSFRKMPLWINCNEWVKNELRSIVYVGRYA